MPGVCGLGFGLLFNFYSPRSLCLLQKQRQCSYYILALLFAFAGNLHIPLLPALRAVVSTFPSRWIASY